MNGQNDDDELIGLDVNKNLKPQASDNKIIKISSLDTILEDSLNNTLNAVEFEDILSNVKTIKTCLTLQSLTNKPKKSFLTPDNMIRLLQKFLVVPPRDSSEIIILEPVIDLVILLIESSSTEDILKLIANMFEKSQINLAITMRNITLPISLYSKVPKLMTIILKTVNSDFKIMMFEEMLLIAEDCFKKRQLEHEKQVLLVLTSLSSHSIPTEVIRKSLKKLFHLTVAVKTMTQMSSRIQKLSLISIGNLLSQINEQTLKIKPNNIIYLSGLCGHKDFEIRNLSWCILDYFSKTTLGVNLLKETLQHLPGGFHACCLTTMMDETEVTMIRVTAGDVLANIITSELLDRQIVDKLFQSHHVFKTFEDILTHSSTNIDVIRVYCTVLLSYVKNQPKDNHIDLMLRLSTPMRSHQRDCSFLEMAGEICRLFVILDAQSSHKISKQLAGDFQFLSVLYEFFNPNISDTIPKVCLVNIITFSMLVVRQNSAYNYFCDMFDQGNQVGLKFLEKAMKNEWNNALLQRKAIDFSTFMLLKSQLHSKDDTCSFSGVIDRANADFFFEILENKFTKIFLEKSFSFTNSPVSSIRSVCDALSVLLKTSQTAIKSARNRKFLKKILQPIKEFFEKVGNVSSEYVRRYGEHKLKPIISNFILLFGIIFNWYSNDVLRNNEDSLEITKILLTSWSWSGHDKEMRVVVINTMAFLSDKSVKICQDFTTVTCSGITFTILQAIAKYVTNESLKAGNRSVDIIQTCLRILQNCCACSEGRSFLVKENVLSIFDRFQIFEKKMTTSCVTMYKSWLELWEVSSRYKDTLRYQNMQILEVFCEMSNKELSMCSWEIIRNLSFKKEFRNTLINRNYSLKLANKVMENGTHEEKLLVCLIVWRLIVNNSNVKSKLKDIHLVKSIRKISKCTNFSSEDVDLQKVISIILEIIDS